MKERQDVKIIGIDNGYGNIKAAKPCPVPAYITCNPYAASYGVVPTGCNSGCGCGGYGVAA